MKILHFVNSLLCAASLLVLPSCTETAKYACDTCLAPLNVGIAAVESVVNEDGQETLLHIHCRGSSEDVIQRIRAIVAVTPGAFEKFGDKGYTPLNAAIASGKSQQFVSSLISLGANPSFPDNNGNNALHVAVARHNADADVARFILDCGVDVNIPNKLGETPLHLAMQFRNRLELASLLLERGADPNVVSPQGKTPLHLAMYRGSPEIASLLLERGADPNVVSPQGETPLQYAVRKRMSRGYRLFEKKEKCKPDLVEALVFSGADVPSAMPDILVSPYWFEILEILPDKDQHLSRKYEISYYVDALKLRLIIEKLSLVDAAVVLGKYALFDYLAERGYTCSQTTPRGYGLLHIATALGNRPLVERLLSRGHSSDSLDISGQTALHVACAAGADEMGRFLVKQGADLDQCTADGHTALHLAIRAKSQPLVISLLERGAQWTCTREGESPLELAAEVRMDSVIPYLLNHSPLQGRVVHYKQEEEVGASAP